MSELNKIDYAALLLGARGNGKSTRAKQRAIAAVRGELPGFPGIKCRVFVLDPTESWTDVAATFDSPAAWGVAVDGKSPQPGIIRFLRLPDITKPTGQMSPSGKPEVETWEAPRQLCQLAVDAAKASNYLVPSVFVYDEGKKTDIKENYVPRWFTEFDATRRHSRTGWIFNAQDGAVHEDVISAATEIDIFNLVNRDDLGRLAKKASVPAGILSGIPTLPSLQFRTGRPNNPGSWR